MNPTPTLDCAPGRLPRAVRFLTPSVVAFALAVTALLPQGDNPGAGRHLFDPETGQAEVIHDFGVVEVVAINVGAMSGYLLLVSPLFAFPRALAFVPARWLLGVHRWLGSVILALALVHGTLLPLIGFRRGWLSGLVAIVLLGLHGLSGMLKPRLTRAWGGDGWRYLHLATAWSALIFAAFHAFLSGTLPHHDH